MNKLAYTHHSSFYCYYRFRNISTLVILISFFLFSMSVQANEFKDLHEKLNDPKYTWMDKQIKRDLAAFEEKGISLHMLESTWQDILASPEKKSAYLIRYKIVNNNITFSSPTIDVGSNFYRVRRVRFINFIKEIPHPEDQDTASFLL